MCNQLTFHHQFRIDTGKTEFEQQTDSILSAYGSYGQRTQGSGNDRLGSTALCTINAQCMEETSKHGVLGRHQSCSNEKIEVLSDAIERHHSFTTTLPTYCIPKVVRMKTGEVIYEKVYASPRPPPKISLKHDWMKELGSEVARQPEREVARQAKSFQPNPNPNHDRTGRPVVCSENTFCSQEIDTRFSRESKNSILEEGAIHDRTVRPVVCSQRAHQFVRLSRSFLPWVDVHPQRLLRWT